MSDFKKTMRDEYEDMLYYMHMADNEKLSDDTREIALEFAQDCKFRIRKLMHDFSKPTFAYESDGHRGDFGFDGDSYICRIFVSDSKSMSDEDKSRVCDYYDRPYQYCDYDCTGQWFDYGGKVVRYSDGWYYVVRRYCDI